MSAVSCINKANLRNSKLLVLGTHSTCSCWQKTLFESYVLQVKNNENMKTSQFFVPMLQSTLQLRILVLCLFIAFKAIFPFEVGELVIVRNLKLKGDESPESIRAAVTTLNNSIVKITHCDDSRKKRHEVTIQSLEDPSVQLMVPPKKLQHLSRIMVYDYSHYTNSSANLMLLTFKELLQDPRNVFNLTALTCDVLMTRKSGVLGLDATKLSNALNYLQKHIPNELKYRMKQRAVTVL